MCIYIRFIYAHLHEYSVMGGILHVFLLLFFIVYHYGSRQAPNCYSPCNISYIQKNRLPLFPFPSISTLLLPPLVIIAWTISPAVIRVKGSREVIEGTESEGGDISSVNELKTALMHPSVWQIWSWVTCFYSNLNIFPPATNHPSSLCTPFFSV